MWLSWALVLTRLSLHIPKQLNLDACSLYSLRFSSMAVIILRFIVGFDSRTTKRDKKGHTTYIKISFGLRLIVIRPNASL